jgi:hypothetical protein
MGVAMARPPVVWQRLPLVGSPRCQPYQPTVAYSYQATVYFRAEETLPCNSVQYCSTVRTYVQWYRL